ncbi:MAG TPA: TonB-dependent receptor, partial [Cyclobacteriaceae bacterium]|nr:TonB-dependent receptor [Cyclobacteriaceae bacterium]
MHGAVLDSKTREPLIGASVSIKEDRRIGTSVSLSGTFRLIIARPGTYTLVCSFVGYRSIEKIVTINTQDKVPVDFELEQNADELNEIVVSGQMDKTSDEFALHTEKNSQSIINVMSAKTIQLMPDITVANILQRFSGVSVDRSSSGDAQYAIIRGMPQRYSYTLVNGIKIPSPDNKNRYVPMDLFPADLLDRLEVIKALTPSMEGDATGGAMNLVMKDAPSTFTVTANVGTGTNVNALQNGFSTFSSWQSKAPVQTHAPGYVATPSDFSYKNFDYHNVAPVNQIYGFSIGDRLTRDKKLGAIFAGSVQDVFRSTSSVFIAPNSQAGQNNTPVFDDYNLRQYSLHQKRYGLHVKADYRFNEKNRLKLYSMFVKLDEVQRRHTIDTSLSIGRNGPGNAIVYLLNRSKVQQQNIYNLTLQGDHDLRNALKVNWSAVYSQAHNAVPDWSEYSTSQQVGYGKVILTKQALYDFNRHWLANSDIDYSGYFNVSHRRNIGSSKLEISAGGLYRDKTRNNIYYTYSMTPSTSPAPLFIEGTSTLSPDQWQFGGADAAKGNVVNPNTYVAHEKIAAGYLQGNMNFDKLEVLGGVRAEHTHLDYETPLNPQTVPGAKGTTTYLDILPSVHFKYKLNPNVNLRASYYRSINRQGFFELPPSLVPGDNFTEGGNPNLKHAAIENVDIRFEQFTKAMNQILVGAFFKYLENPIETYWQTGGATSSQFIQPNNINNATNFGFELAI